MLTALSLRGRFSATKRGLTAFLVAGVAALGVMTAVSTPPAAAQSEPSLALAKSASVSNYSAPGTLITYSYDVINTGDSTLTNITVTDPATGLSAIDCAGGTNVISTLAVGASQICTATYTTTQANVDSGSISNTGTASASTTIGTISGSSSLTIPAVQAPAVTVSKVAEPQSYSSAGTVLTYEYVVTNTGNVTLTNVEVTDGMSGLSPIDCGGGNDVVPSLAPGASADCSATYTTTARDVAKGGITNTATAAGTTPSGTSVQSNTMYTEPVTGQPFVCNQPTYFLSQGTASSGGTGLYTGTEGSGSSVFSPVGAPYSQTYNAMGYDPANGYLYAMVVDTNILIRIGAGGAYTALGPVTGLPVISEGYNTGAFDAAGNLWISEGGTSLAYEIDVTASTPYVVQTVTLSGATWAPDDWSLADGYFWGLSRTTIYRASLPSGTVTAYSAPSQVAPVSSSNPGTYGAAWTFGNGELGFSNNDTGEIYEIAVSTPATPTFTVTASYQGPVAGQNNDGASCGGEATGLEVTTDGQTTVTPDGTVTYKVNVTNDGPGESSGFGLNDQVPGDISDVSTTTPGCTATGNDVQCDEGSMNVGDTFPILITGTAEDVEDTCGTNTATVTANEADPNTAGSSSNLQTCTAPGIDIVKSANVSSFDGSGVPITYTYDVTNTSSNAALTNVTVTDPMSGLSAIDCGDGTNVIAVLGAGQSQNCHATYETTESDEANGSITNTGTAAGTAPDGSSWSASSTLTILGSNTPALGLTTTAKSSSFDAVSDVIHYKFHLKNTGGVTLTDVAVNDSMSGLSAIECGGQSSVPSLAPGASSNCTATYDTTAADASNGSVSTTASASSTTPTGTVTSSPSTVTVTYAPLLITAYSLPNGIAGAKYSATLTASGATAPYQWSVATGTHLPRGLALSKSGKLSGRPGSAGTYAVTVEVTDTPTAGERAVTVSAALTLTVY